MSCVRDTDTLSRMPPATQRTWSADEIGFAIRDWLLSFGRLPRAEDWRPNTLPPELYRYGALREDSRARWPSAKSVRRCFASWEHAYSHALTGSDVLVLSGDPDATQVNVDEAAGLLVQRAAVASLEAALRPNLDDQGVERVVERLRRRSPPGVIWTGPTRPQVPPPLSQHRPRLR